jgi:chromosome segregation ATPase
MFLILVVVCGLGYWYYEDQQARMAILQENNAKLTVAVRINEDTIAVMRDHETRQAAQITELQSGLNQATQERKDLESKFRERDIAALGRSDAKLLETKINKATQRVFDDLQTATGGAPDPAPLPPQKPAAKGAANAQ